MLDENQLSDLLISISNRVGSSVEYLPIVEPKFLNETPYILITKTGYTFGLIEKGHTCFEELDLDLDELIYKVFYLISYDVLSEKYRKHEGEFSYGDDVNVQREKMFRFLIEFLGKVNPIYISRITKEIEEILLKYPYQEIK